MMEFIGPASEESSQDQKKKPRIFPPTCFRLASSWSIIPADVVITMKPNCGRYEKEEEEVEKEKKKKSLILVATRRCDAICHCMCDCMLYVDESVRPSIKGSKAVAPTRPSDGPFVLSGQRCRVYGIDFCFLL